MHALFGIEGGLDNQVVMGDMKETCHWKVGALVGRWTDRDNKNRGAVTLLMKCLPPEPWRI